MTLLAQRFVILAVLSSAVACGQEPRAHDWRLRKTLAAPEAHQAAAADEAFVYAIASTQIAKYDRQSGQRLALSSGDAKHLNSGFLFEGRLYCAHSNYPQIPEQSEIKVLDVATMRLSTFKDFGNFGGSLTWAVQRDGHWWCSFARYGADNANTFLVKFDRDWNEKGRWTYPPELIAQLGRYSVSGGVWRGDDLVVTGHDDPLLFPLRLPAAGTVLQLIETQGIPFTGQGIATDPLTGGLVGIHRAKRQVLLAGQNAAASLLLRVLSYNIHQGEGVDGKLDLERIANVIRAAEPDLVALQEVDQKAERSQSVDQPAELSRLTKMHVAFGDNIALQGGKYGNAVLSRFPIREKANHQLPRFDNGEQRGVLELEIDLPDKSEPLRFLATHLDHRAKDAERLASAQKINELVAENADRPTLLAGDLNDVPDSPVLEEFGKEFLRTNPTPLLTIPVKNPNRQIDYILFRPNQRWKVIETRVIDEQVASDHRPILSVLELLPLSPGKN